jgi:PIN domain nuclease of toxin-antitoxin system
LKYLLDTHVWYWSHEDPDRLGARVRDLIEDASNELWLSPASIWEFGMLADNARVKLPVASVSEWVRRALEATPMRDATITREVAAECRAVALEHDDPADRFLAASARAYDLTLVTADQLLLRGRGYKVLANK